MPLSMSALRLLQFPPNPTASFPHQFLHFRPLKALPLPHATRRSANLQLFLLRSQAQQAVELDSAQDNLPVEEEEEEEEEEAGSSSNTRVFVQNVPWTCTPDDLRPLFEKFGTVTDIEFSMYNKTKNRGLAFVSMGSHEEAAAALENLHDTEFEGRVIKLNWANPKKESPSTPPQPKPMPVHNLFVANLPFQARANDLKDFFNAENSNVVSAEVIFDANRRSVGYGFVSFNTKAEAEAALKAFQGKEFMGRQIRVAPSKKFLRQETKENIEAASESPESESIEVT